MATMTMSKVDILTAPTKDSAVLLNRRQNYNSEILSLLAPTLQAALNFQRVLGAVSVFVFVRAYFLASCMLYASSTLALYSFIASRFAVFHAASLLGKAARMSWNTKAVKQLRKKLVFEFFTLILGAGGNNICLMVFWPGWWVLGFVGVAVWTCTS